MKTRGILTVAAAVVVGVWLHARPAAQEQIDQKMIAAIKDEGMRRSDVSRVFHTFTDVIGARLSGSPAHVEAARWAVEQFKT